MTNGAFSWNVDKLYSELKLATDNLHRIPGQGLFLLTLLLYNPYCQPCLCQNTSNWLHCAGKQAWGLTNGKYSRIISQLAISLIYSNSLIEGLGMRLQNCVQQVWTQPNCWLNLRGKKLLGQVLNRWNAKQAITKGVLEGCSPLNLLPFLRLLRVASQTSQMPIKGAWLFWTSLKEYDNQVSPTHGSHLVDMLKWHATLNFQSQ